MALTRLEVETMLFRRLGPAMARADMNTTADGSNDIMGDAITYSLMEWGYNAPADFTDPKDSDLTQVMEEDYQKFLGVCEWRLVKSILGNLDDTDEKLGPTGMWNSQYAKQMERYLEDLTARLITEFGWGPTTLSTGTLKIISMQEEDS